MHTKLPTGRVSLVPIAQGTPPSSSVRTLSVSTQLLPSLIDGLPTRISDVVAGFVEGTGVELKTDDCEDDDGEE